MALNFGNQTYFNSSGAANFNCVDVLNVNQFVVVSEDIPDSDKGTAKIGTIDGTNITFGTEKEYTTGRATYNSVAAISESGFIVACRDVADTSNGNARVGIVSGTDITFGSKAAYSNGASYNSLVPLSESGFIVVYDQLIGGNRGRARIGTVSGTTITFGDIAEFVSSGSAEYISAALLDTSGFVVVYTDKTDLNHGTAKIGTISGTTITFGDEYEFAPGGTIYNSVAVLSPTKFVVVYRDNDNSNHGTVKIGEVSGTTITFGSEYEFVSTAAANYISVAYLSENEFVIVAEDQSDSSHGNAWIGIVSGTIVTFVEKVKYYDQAVRYNDVAVFNRSKFVVVFKDQAGDSYGVAKIGLITVLASADLFIHGYTEIETSGSLFTNGHVSSSGFNDLFIEGYESFQASGNLYLQGHKYFQSSSDIYTYGYSSINDLCNLFIFGGQSLWLYTTAHQDISGQCNLFNAGPLPFSGFSDLYANGYDAINESRNLFIYGLIKISGAQVPSLFVHGYIEMSNWGNLFTDGSGIIPHNGNLSLFVNGYEPKPVLVCPILDLTASIQIKDSLIKIYQSRIDALINQLGKNVYLEFDPIREPCPNCTYDTMRKRSTGVYKLGGPRPFVRGRQCPYCKGRGLIETTVNKCIKCLIKWNPKDAKNFGISITQKKGVVRLKTYLTEIDDLRRARTIIVNHDISDQMKLIMRLIKGPTPVGLREDRYCISFWEVI